MKTSLLLLLCLAVSVCGQLGRAAEDEKARLDCSMIEPSVGKSSSSCTASSCTWRPATKGIPNTPYCFLNANQHGYSVKTVKPNAAGLEAELDIKADTKQLKELKSHVDKLKLSVKHLTPKIVRFSITDPQRKRYEVPAQKVFNIPPGGHASASEHYEVKLEEGGNFRLLISRKATGAHLIDTSIGPLLYTDQFLQFATYVPTENMFGWGENYHTKFRHSFNYTTYPIFAHDRPPMDPNDHYYGTHPFYMIVEDDGKAHGVFLLNSNAMTYTTLPAPGLSLKTVGGIIDMFVFVGDNPEEVIQLYTSVIGRQTMPPFWGLGFQLCRYGYKNLDDVKAVVKRNLDNNVPLDVQYCDIDYMDEFQDFTYSRDRFGDLPKYVNETKEKNHLHWTFILDPAIQGDKPGYKAFDEGYKREVFVRWPDSVPVKDRKNPEHVPTDKNVFYGKVWPKGPVAFPDFFKNVTRTWWIEMIKDFHKELNFDALWIDMNEPSNFVNHYCPDDGLNVGFPNMKLDTLQHSTICMGTVQGEQNQYRHYDVHNLYGWSETEPTQTGLQEATGKRGFVVSRSTYPSSGQFGSHWLGDNLATWEQLHASIVGMLEFNMFGITFVGADLCGFNQETTPELCKRWLQLGAYYPFSRSHNADNAHDQDPGFWVSAGHPEVTHEMIKAYEVRYQLMHYIYTLFYLSNARGDTVVRSLFQEFSTINSLRDIDDQFLLGPNILVSPFLKEHQTEVTAVVPPGHWYRFNDQFIERIEPINEQVKFVDSQSHRPLLLRENFILPIVRDLPKPLNTYGLRRKPIELWIAPNWKGQASGHLFWDDGESIRSVERNKYNYYKFNLNNCTVSVAPQHRAIVDGKDEVLKISKIRIALPEPQTLTSVTARIGSVELKEIEHNTQHVSVSLGEQLNLFRLNDPVNVTFAANGKCFLN